MLKLFFKKQYRIESLMYNYLESLRMTQRRFHEAMRVCLERSSSEYFEFLTKQTHKFESRADDIREEIKTLMYGKALLPESRGDIMGLLEAIDEVPRVFEVILDMLRYQKLVIPKMIIKEIGELIDVSMASCDLMIKQIEALLKRNQGIEKMVTEIDHNESLCDHIQRRMIFRIFESDLDPFEKLQLKEMIVHMGEISDQADRVSKRANIINMKRNV